MTTCSRCRAPDRFTLQLIGHQLQTLRTFTAQSADSIDQRDRETLERLELVRRNEVCHPLR
jgi:hypothetical protein